MSCNLGRVIKSLKMGSTLSINLMLVRDGVQVQTWTNIMERKLPKRIEKSRSLSNVGIIVEFI